MASGSTYTKRGGSRSLLPVTEAKKAKPSQDPGERELPSGYTKPDGELSPALLIIVSVGVKREIDYFSVFQTSQKKSFPRLTVKFICRTEEQPDGGLSPIKLYREARKVERIAEDEIYLLCDVDDFTNELIDIKPLCEKENVTLIISNSCFEVWLYYGKHSVRPDKHEVPFACPDKPSKISRAFKKHLNTVVPGGVDPRKAIFDIEAAIENARKNYSQDEYGIPHLYCTNMYLLADRLFELINPELGEFQVG